MSLHFVDYILDMNNIYKRIAEKLGLRENAVKATAELLDEGATVPFISRYRKERTGSLDEVAVRGIESALKSERGPEWRIYMLHSNPRDAHAQRWHVKRVLNHWLR